MDLVGAVIGLIPVILSLSVHEFAHAWTASRLGDDTAARMGRLTLNPIAHIDPFGTVILPLILVLPTSRRSAGRARSRSIPRRFRRDVSMGRGHGAHRERRPDLQLALAIVATLLLGLLVRARTAGTTIAGSSSSTSSC